MASKRWQNTKHCAVSSLPQLFTLILIKNTHLASEISFCYAYCIRSAYFYNIITELIVFAIFINVFRDRKS